MKKFKTHFLNDHQLPLVIEPTNPQTKLQDLLEILSTENSYLKDNLLKYGGLLLRNFPVQNADDFADVIEHMNTGRSLDYIGGDSPRNKIKRGIYTSTEAPPDIKIPLHNELSFVKKHPTHIYFFCEQPAPKGGATILGDARKILKSVDESVKAKFNQKGLKYVSCYFHQSALMDLVNKWQNAHKSWTQVFETNCKEDVEKKCRENEFGYKWNVNDWLQINQIRPATMNHPHTQESVWFNQVHLYDFNPKLLGWWRYVGAKLFYFQKHTRLHEVFYADGSRIDREDIYHILDVLDANTIEFPWQKGDVMILDNVLAMHGRAVFEGKRRVLAAMTG
jgi:alpha-ketoglutarate-dependent taurine dioxygenase